MSLQVLAIARRDGIVRRALRNVRCIPSGTSAHGRMRSAAMSAFTASLGGIVLRNYFHDQIEQYWFKGASTGLLYLIPDQTTVLNIGGSDDVLFLTWATPLSRTSQS